MKGPDRERKGEEEHSLSSAQVGVSHPRGESWETKAKQLSRERVTGQDPAFLKGQHSQGSTGAEQCLLNGQVWTIVT